MKTIRKSLGSAQKPHAFPSPTGLSCFISYSTKDQLFVDRLYSDLERRGIRCWFARDDLPIGNPILKNVHDAIRSRDKFILVLSRNSIDSNWVEKEVLTAFEEEDSRGQTVLFPVRLDDEVLKTQKAWASHLRSRNIGDFRAWRNSQAYKRTFDRIIRELKPPEKSAPARKYKPLLERVKLFPRDLPVSVIFNDHVSAIKTALTRDRSVGQRIVVVYGPPGYGKSYVISAWWRDSGRLTFRNAALYLDCSQSPGDQIIRSISSYFCSKESEMLDDELAGAMRAAGKSIIILDGLSAVEPEGAYTLKTEADVVALRKVRDLLRFIKDKDLPVSMVLGIQTSRMDDRVVIASLVANHNNVTSIQMKRLSNREGLIVFKELGVDGISDDDLGELANQLMGLPIAIEAAAIVLATSGNYGDEVARERLITLTSHRENDFHIFGQFLKRIVDSLGNTPGQAEAHPYAFMRLLSLFNGRVHRSRVETILAPGRIERLSASKLDWLVSRTFGLVKLDGDYLYIHPFVRSIILAEIDSILLGNEVDQNITLAEIQWIHIVAAHTFLSKIDPDPTQISNVDIEQIEGALHHLLSLSSLGSIEASIIETDQVQMLFAKVDGRNPASIMKYCIHDIVNKYLVDDRHKVTRILGHYETKARLLNFFAPHLGKFVEHEFIDKRDAQKIYSEMGICWMHSGRLKLANDVLSVALRFSPKYKPGSRFIDVLSSDSLQDDWVQFADLSTAQALIIMREGRSKDIIDMFFQNTVDIANIVLQSVEDGFSERKLLLTIAPALRAARRVITRSAQIALAAGSVDEAVRKFEYASFINAKMHRPFLTGDAARRYIEALVRVRNTYPSAMKIAREVLQANLDLKAVEGTKSQRQSNDLIALLVTDAMLDRVEGRIDECSNKLSKLAEHEFVRSGEAPYAAIQELRLETIRLRISREDIRSDLDKEIRFFFQQLCDSHHGFLATQSRLLLAELRPPDFKTIVREIENNARNNGWGLWEVDVRHLVDGGSVVRDVGI